MRQIIGALIGYWLYPISLLTIRNKRKWCFGGTANSKYLFLLSNFKDIRVRAIWFSNDIQEIRKLRSLGYEAYKKVSLIGLYHLLTSKVYFITHGIGDINRWTCGNVLFVNLYHGIPYKKISLDDKRHKKTWTYLILHPTSNRSYDLQLTTSPFVTEIFRRSFRVRNNKFVEAMLPRNMILLKPQKEILQFLQDFGEKSSLETIEKIKRYRFCYIYMPTFRDTNNDFIDDSHINLGELEKVLEKRDILFIFKLHPATKSEKLRDVVKYRNMMIIDKNIDVYPILPFTTGLITDYSSIYFDYILMKGKRVVFYTFDKDIYMSKDRDFNFDETYMRGEYCSNFHALLNLLDADVHCGISQDETITLFWNNHNSELPIIENVKKLVYLN